MSSALNSPVNLVAMLVILCLGLLANAMSTAVWTRQIKNRSGAFLLCCLSIADALFCLTLCIPVLMTLTHFHSELLGCYEVVIILPFSVFGNASRLLTVVLMAQRWVAVFKPLAVARLCSLRRQVVMVTCILLPPLIFLALGIYVIHLSSTQCLIGIYNATEELKILTYFPWVFPTWYTLIVFVIVIFGILLLHSTCTIRNVHTIRPDNTPQPWQRDFKLHTTVLVLCMAAFSLLDTLLLLVLTLRMWGAITIDAGSIESHMIAYVWITILNCSINFLLYSCFGRDFRSILRRQWDGLVGRSCCKKSYLQDFTSSNISTTFTDAYQEEKCT